MEHQLSATSLLTRLAIASILLTTVMVHGLPLLPFGQNGLRDFPSSSSSSSSSAATSSGELSEPTQTLKEDIAALGGLSPQQAYLLALALLVQNEDSQPTGSLFNTAPRSFSRGNNFEKRGHKRFDFGFLGMDTYGDVINNAMAGKGPGRAGGSRSIVDRMERQG